MNKSDQLAGLFPLTKHSERTSKVKWSAGITFFLHVHPCIMVLLAEKTDFMQKTSVVQCSESSGVVEIHCQHFLHKARFEIAVFGQKASWKMLTN